ncbi:MAG: hypothetical protein COA73_00940 [Candidatus Hydrogenedentota bacterium]|nr:MAG: hypothetical protein COA73_00940 [Candidatus Hydrogenedentota bacterium]
MQKGQNIVKCVLVSLVLSVTTVLLEVNHASASDALDGIDSYILESMDAWEVPGLAIAVVKDNEAVFVKGYGVRTYGNLEKVDQNTLFAIGSITKGMTASSIAALVDQKKLAWDDKVTTYLPWFEFYDPYVTREITIRDLLSHRSGLGRRDALWYGSKLSRRKILERVKRLKPSYGFRAGYGYQNVMFLAAGEVAAEASGMSWDSLVAKKLFEPLKMHRSNTSVLNLVGKDNVAAPHTNADGTLQAIEYRNLDSIAPAGSINSTAHEMTNFLQMLLSKGRFGDLQVLSEESIREMWTPHTNLPLNDSVRSIFPSTHVVLYGLGWGLRDFRGHWLVEHSGGIDGMTSHTIMVPDDTLGVIVLTNLGSNGLAVALAYGVIERFISQERVDYSAILLDEFRKQ